MLKKCNIFEKTLWWEPEGRLSEFLFKQDENGVVQIFDGEASGRGRKDSVIAGNAAENPFRLPERVQQASNQLRSARLVWITTTASL